MISGLPKPYRTRKHGTELIYFCNSSLCTGRPPRLELNIVTGLYNCLRCGRSGYLKEVVGRKKILQVPEEQEPGPLVSVPGSIRRGLVNRGFDPEYLVHRYGLRWDGFRLCWPVGGDLETPGSWWRRGMYSWNEPKVLFPSGSYRGVLGEHLLGHRSHVVVTEGDFKAASIPLPWVGVAVGGVTLAEEQRDTILYYRPTLVYICLDGGRRFEEKAVKMMRMFTSKRQDAIVVSLPSEKGPDDLPMKERVRTLSAAYEEVS